MYDNKYFSINAFFFFPFHPHLLPSTSSLFVISKMRSDLVDTREDEYYNDFVVKNIVIMLRLVAESSKYKKIH